MGVDRRCVLAGLMATVVPLSRRAVASEPPKTALTLEASLGMLRVAGPADTAVWAYNGQVPGPLLRLRHGDALKVRLANKLSQPTSLCWHGVRIVNAMDGVAGLTQKPVLPGETFEYDFTPPDSGLFWYHPHAWPDSAEQIGRGLYGVLIVDEQQPPAVDEDLLIVLQDWALDEHGQSKGDFLAAAQASGQGRIGSTITINSKPIPAHRSARPGSRIRLRLLNVCSARIAVISFVGTRATVIAIDGQPSELFEPAGNTVPIGPGSRFEVMLDLPSAPSSTSTIVLRGDGVPDQVLVEFAFVAAALPARGAVAKLAANPALPTRIALEKSLKLDLLIASVAASRVADQPGAPAPVKLGNPAAPAPPEAFWSLGGRASDGFSGKPLFVVKQGGAVTLAFVNRTAFVQQMHVHGHVFRVLHDLDDGWDPYWRESVLVAPGRTKHVAFVADNPGRWAIESLILDRQVTGLAGFFIVESRN